MKRNLTLREIQLAEFDILCNFDAFCKEHNLRYYLHGGTLLGAVRHKGFIPWDDDIDLLMLRPDYERLATLLRKTNRFPYSFARHGKGVFPFIKIENPAISVRGSFANLIKQQEPLWIDVFPIDGLPDDEAQAEAIYRRKEFLKSWIYFGRSRPAPGKTPLRRLVKPFIHWLCTTRLLAALIDFSAKRIPISDAKYTATMVWRCGTLTPEPIPLDDWLHPVPVSFEGREFLAPRSYNDFLTAMYGDYMTLPPEEKRKHHILEAWIEESSSAD